MVRYFTAAILLIMLASACSTGKKALERGDYYNATLQAVNRLRSNPDSKKALQAVKESYPLSLQYFQSRIDYALSTNAAFKYTEIVGYYENMNHLSDEVSRCPAALRIFPNVNYYTSELVNARNMAAEEQYASAIKNEELNTRLSWKEAYLSYRKSEQFVPGYKDVQSRIDNAKWNATLKVIVEQIPVPSRYQLTSDFFLNQVIESLKSNRPNEFVEYYSPEAAQNAGISTPDQVLRMNFDDFVIGQVYDKETVKEFSRDSVEVGSVSMPDGTKKKVYNTVKAKLTTNRRELTSNGVLNVTIIDFPLNTVLSQRKFQGQYVWYSEWGFFNGDERALSSDQLAMCKRKAVPPPGHQELFIEFTRPIFNQVSPFLKSFYSKY